MHVTHAKPCNLSGPVMKPGFLGQQRGFFVFYTFIIWIVLPNSLANQCLNQNMLLLGISADTPRYSYIRILLVIYAMNNLCYIHFIVVKSPSSNASHPSLDGSHACIIINQYKSRCFPPFIHKKHQKKPINPQDLGSLSPSFPAFPTAQTPVTLTAGRHWVTPGHHGAVGFQESEGGAAHAGDHRDLGLSKWDGDFWSG